MINHQHYNMPLPNPNQNETKKDFIARCMANSVMNKEYPNASQRRAVCESQWGRKKQGREFNKKINNFIK